ncbi:envelope stress response membrane protein PspC [Shewanella sp. OPT22]|uniref:envelope stress response membrane protein PspC n=1 Tax=Parashewanella hymeniacidonis TaxID=2807618 RepID=UPI001020A128|nr:envelope stress response membrane protein PspC [Parashewanella hymeniacidonis]MBM7073784.1 envelope stress response membrane protein PspC [Parashewanella hymeniacidonis]RYV02527.1 envelope stress response membrane protein PspC [Shewanella sp. OPT22]
MTTSNRKTLYRNPKEKKLAGVCAGIAEFFGLETWLVRVVTASIFLLGGAGIIFVGYVVLWLILDEKSVTHDENSLHRDIEVKKKFWQAGEPATQALQDVNQQFRALELRLRNMERHVTSDSYDLKRQIDNL